MTIQSDTSAYEAWLRTRCDVDEKALQRKHRRMKESPFRFLRATYYRWARLVGDLLPDLAQAPHVLCVGDIHVENFGTWRDDDGRLVWGVNDFDEAAAMPFVHDLVRLVTSIRLAPEVDIGRKASAACVLKGYLDGLARPRPTLPDELDLDMRDMIGCTDKHRRDFWSDIAALPDAKPPAAVCSALLSKVPAGARKVRFAARTAGGGSLGRPRHVLIARWNGGTIVREAKAIVPSAWDWVHGAPGEPHYIELSHSAYRSPDPWLTVDTASGVVVRRLSASNSKIEWERIPDGALHERLVRAMGFDLGALHAADATGAETLQRHLADLPDDWLHNAARIMHRAVEEDYEAWCG